MARTDTPTMIPPPSPELAERRYVYNGQSPAPDHEVATRGNRPVKRRKQSPFNVIAIVVTVSLLIVVYVWNKITVNQLFEDIGALQAQHQRILAANEQLRADITKKSTLERIEKIALGDLSMQHAKEQPRMFELDPERVERLLGE